jgi:hypothetical protein
MRLTARFSVLAATLLVVGCARQINITPPLQALDAPGTVKINKTVGYYTSPANRAKEVETPGGGGDRVKYRPYSEAEPALKQVLSNLFTRAVYISSPDDKQWLASNDIAYVFVLPVIETDSSSDSMVTWPPTRFSMTLDCRALDRSGATVWQTKVRGQGIATFSEFKNDTSLSARRASRDAFLLLQREIYDAKEFR